MTFVVASELFGRRVPSFGFGVLVVAGIVVFLLMSRNGGLATPSAGTGSVGRGPMHKCHRCGVNFQPEHVELTPTGDTHKQYDERCPNCGWELDWKEPDKKSGGTW